jgi:hypothetical protein
MLIFPIVSRVCTLAQCNAETTWWLAQMTCLHRRMGVLGLQASKRSKCETPVVGLASYRQLVWGSYCSTNYTVRCHFTLLRSVTFIRSLLIRACGNKWHLSGETNTHEASVITAVHASLNDRLHYWQTLFDPRQVSDQEISHFCIN